MNPVHRPCAGVSICTFPTQTRHDARHGARQAVGIDALTRHQRLATRFLISLLQRYGRDAPAVLRGMADEPEGLAGEAAGEVDRVTLGRDGAGGGLHVIAKSCPRYHD